MGALKVWDGFAWQTLANQGRPGSNVFVGPSTPPGTPTSGDMWYDTDEVSGLTLPLTLANGGTGGTSALTARSSLGTAAAGNSPSTAGAPTTGTWARGDGWLDSTGAQWSCTVAGTPGTWVMRPRMYVTDIRHAGPHTGSYGFTCPFKCDVGCMVGISMFSSATGNVAYQPRVDGVDTPGSAGMYFNEAGSHKAISTAFTLRAVAAGAHTITYRTLNAVSSDAGDYGAWILTMVEVP